MYPTIELRFLGEPVLLKTYSLFICLSLGLGILLSYPPLKRKIKRPKLFLLGLSLSFFMGARMLHFIINHRLYEETTLHLFSLKATGLSFYGGILFSMVALVILHFLKKIHLWEITDALILPFGLSFFMMRMGCFLNGCCFGKFTTSFLGVHVPYHLRNTSNSLPFLNFIEHHFSRIHPTQLYEGFGAFIGVIVFYLIKNRWTVPGLLTLAYGIYLTGIRWIVFYFRVLPYPSWVLDYFYPGLYFSCITMAILISIKRCKSFDLSLYLLGTKAFSNVTARRIGGSNAASIKIKK